MKYIFTILIGIFILNPAISQEDNNNKNNKKSIESKDSVKGDCEISFVCSTDYFKNNFNQFSNILGNKNTALMNKLFVTYNWGMAANYKKYQFGLNYGFGDAVYEKDDSLNLSFSSYVFRLDFGYKLFDRKKTVLMPVFSFKMIRYNLVNSIDENIKIEEYLSNRDLDLRFTQLTGFMGLNASIKKHGKFFYIPMKYWTIGIYGGYHFKLNKYPWIHSSGNKLESEYQIEMGNLNLGLNLNLHLCQ